MAAGDVPADRRCPTCRTERPVGATKCPGCGRVFGETNRCPYCHAVAGVLPRLGRTVCAACGKPRAGETVVGARRSAPDSRTKAMLLRARARLKRLVGFVAVGGGVLASAGALTILPGDSVMTAALVSNALCIAVGVLAFRSAARSSSEADALEGREREGRLLRLAREEGGRLTATGVAEAFDISVDEADAALTRLVGDGSRVDVDVDDEGLVSYVFRELVPALARVRVAVDEGAEVDEQTEPEAADDAVERRAAALDEP